MWGCMIQFDDVAPYFFKRVGLKPPTDSTGPSGGFEADDARTSWIRYLSQKKQGGGVFLNFGVILEHMLKLILLEFSDAIW